MWVLQTGLQSTVCFIGSVSYHTNRVLDVGHLLLSTIFDLFYYSRVYRI